jgi:pyruvate dehydrogenase E1 component alpha subunit
MDVFSVYEKMKEIADDVREHSEPWFVEIRTYRYRGHSMSDPQKYRTKEELEEYQNIDPIERLKSYLVAEKVCNEAEISSIEESIEDEVLAAVTFADESPFPDQSNYIPTCLSKTILIFTFKDYYDGSFTI